MSFFSRSKSKGHYPHHSHGSDYYQRHDSGGGFFGKIMRLLTGSRSHPHSHEHRHNDHHGHRYKRHSWS
jgi:hypothetical protein